MSGAYTQTNPNLTPSGWSGAQRKKCEAARVDLALYPTARHPAPDRRGVARWAEQAIHDIHETLTSSGALRTTKVGLNRAPSVWSAIRKLAHGSRHFAQRKLACTPAAQSRARCRRFLRRSLIAELRAMFPPAPFRRIRAWIGEP
jgi:hypothetical protein